MTDKELKMRDFINDEDFDDQTEDLLLQISLLKRQIAEAKSEIDKLQSHKGDPCIYCGIAHDDVQSGPCAGTRDELRAERDFYAYAVKMLTDYLVKKKV